MQWNSKKSEISISLQPFSSVPNVFWMELAPQEMKALIIFGLFPVPDLTDVNFLVTMISTSIFVIFSHQHVEVADIVSVELFH